MNQNPVAHETGCDSFTLLSKQFTPLGRGLDIIDDSVVITYSRRADGSYDEVMKYNVKNKKVFQVQNYREDDQVDIIVVTETGGIDLEMSGKRWEGESIAGVPFGWGCMYDDDSHIVYEGFSNNGVYDGYGTEYVSKIGVKEYEGTLLDGKHCGRGVLYDLNGETTREGEFVVFLVCEQSYHLTDSSFPISNRILHLVIDQYKSPLSRFDILHLSQLKELKIQGESFPWTHSLHVVHHPSIEYIEIEENCFGSSTKGWNTPANLHDVLVSDCPHLAFLSIGDDCFSHASSFCFCGSSVVDASCRLPTGTLSFDWKPLLSTL